MATERAPGGSTGVRYAAEVARVSSMDQKLRLLAAALSFGLVAGPVRAQDPPPRAPEGSEPPVEPRETLPSDAPPSQTPSAPAAPEPTQPSGPPPAPSIQPALPASMPTGPASGSFPIVPPAASPETTKDSLPPIGAPPPPSAMDPAPAPRDVAPTAPPPLDSMLGPKLRDADGSDEKRAESNGLFGPLRFGPVLGGGLPNLLSFGGTLKLTRYLGAGINVGLIPKLRVSFYGEAVLSYREYDIYARVYPFGTGFFLGSGVGYATATGTLTNRYDTSSYARLGLPSSIETRSDGSVKAMVLTPQMGYFHTFEAGFSLGIDVGAQIPIAPSEIEFTTRVSSSIPQALVDQYVTPNDQKVRDTLEKIGRTTLPTLNLKIGWLL